MEQKTNMGRSPITPCYESKREIRTFCNGSTSPVWEQTMPFLAIHGSEISIQTLTGERAEYWDPQYGLKLDYFKPPSKQPWNESPKWPENNQNGRKATLSLPPPAPWDNTPHKNGLLKPTKTRKNRCSQNDISNMLKSSQKKALNASHRPDLMTW